MARLQVATKEEVSTWLEQAGLRIVGTGSSLQSPTGIADEGLLLFWEAKEKACEFWKERIGEWAGSR